MSDLTTSKKTHAPGEWFYHATRAGHVSSIFQHGLRPSDKPNWGGSLGNESRGKIYFAKTLKNAEYYGKVISRQQGEEQQFIPVLRVKIDRSILKQDHEDKESWYSEKPVPGPFEIWDGLSWRPLTQNIALAIEDGEWDEEDEPEELEESVARKAMGWKVVSSDGRGGAVSLYDKKVPVSLKIGTTQGPTHLGTTKKYVLDLFAAAEENDPQDLLLQYEYDPRSVISGDPGHQYGEVFVSLAKLRSVEKIPMMGTKEREQLYKAPTNNPGCGFISRRLIK